MIDRLGTFLTLWNKKPDYVDLLYSESRLVDYGYVTEHGGMPMEIYIEMAS